MSAPQRTIQDLSNSLSQAGELALSGEVIGQANLDLLTRLFPRQKEFAVSNASIEADKSDKNSLYFSAAFQNLAPWGEVEADFCLFDLESERHIFFHFQIPPAPENLSAYIYLSQYSLAPEEALADSFESAPYIPLIDLLQEIEFSQDPAKQVILFSSLDYAANTSPHVNYPDTFQNALPDEQVGAGLNFPAFAALDLDLSSELGEIFGRISYGTIENHGLVFIQVGQPYFRLRKPAEVKTRLVSSPDFDLSLALETFDLTAPLTEEEAAAAEFALTGMVTLNEADPFHISGAFDPLYRTLRLDFKNFPSLQHLINLVSLNDLPAFSQEPVNSLLKVDLTRLAFYLDLDDRGALLAIDLGLNSREPLSLMALSSEKSIRFQPVLDLQIQAPFDAEARLVEGELRGVWTLGRTAFDTRLVFPEYDFSLEMAAGQTLDVDAVFDGILVGIEIPRIDFTTLNLSGNILEKSLLAELSAEEGGGGKWEIDLGDRAVALDDIQLGLSIVAGALDQCEIACQIELSEAIFSLYAAYDETQGFVFSGGTLRGQTLQLSDLTTDVLPGLSLPAGLSELELASIFFSAAPQEGEYSFLGQAAGLWQISDQLALQVAQFEFNKTKGDPLGAVLKVNLPINWTDPSTGGAEGFELRVAAIKAALAGSEWQFECSAAIGARGIPVFTLLGQLAPLIDAFAVAPWPALDSVTLDAFSVAYDSQRGGYTFSSQGSFPLGPGGERLFSEIGYAQNRFSVVFDSPITLNEVAELTGLQDEMSLLLSEGADWDLFNFQRLLLYLDVGSDSLGLIADSSLQTSTEAPIDAAILAVIGKETRLECAWNAKSGEEINILDLFQALDIELEEVDSIIEEALSITGFRLKYDFKPHPAILIAAKSSSDFYENVLVHLEKPEGKWAITIGLTFPERENSLLNLPGVDSPLLSELNQVQFDLAYICFANQANSSLALPAPGDTQKTKQITVQQGLTVGLDLQLAQTRTSLMQKSRELVGEDSISAQLRFHPNEIQVIGDLPGSLSIPIDEGSNFELSQAYLALRLGKGGFAVGLGGSTAFELFNEMRSMRMELALSNEMLALNMQVENGDLLADVSAIPPFVEAVKRLPVLPGVILEEDNYAIQLGVNFVPTAFIFGIMGKFHIGSPDDPYHGEYALVLHAVPGAVKPSYIALELETFDLWAAMEARFAIQRSLDEVDGVVEDLAELAASKSGNEAIHFSQEAIDFIAEKYQALKDFLQQARFEDVRLYWAADNVILPDKSMASRGAGFEGFLKVFGVDAYAKLEFSPGIEQGKPSIFGYAECEPFSLAGLVDVRGNGAGIPLAANDWSPEQPLLTENNQISTPTISTSPDQYRIQPGGPVFILDTDGSPYLQANMSVGLFGFLRTDVDARIDDAGAAFTFRQRIGSGFSSILEVTLEMDQGVPQRFEAYGGMDIDLDFTVPFPLELLGETAESILDLFGVESDLTLEDLSLKIDTQLKAAVDISIDRNNLELIISGMFAHDGITYNMPTLEIRLGVVAFIAKGIDSAAKFTEMVVQHILDHAASIFAPVFEAMRDELAIVAVDLENHAKVFGTEMNDLANEMLVLPAAAFIDKVDTIGKAAVKESETAIREFIQGLDDDVETLIQEADTIIQTGVAEAEKILTQAEETAGEIIQAGVDALNDARDKVLEIGVQVTQELEALAEKIKTLIEDAAKAVEKFFADARAYAEQLLADLKEWGEKLLQDARDLAAKLAAEAERIWADIEGYIDELGKLGEGAVEDLGNLVEDVGSEFERGVASFGDSLAGIFV